MFRFAPSRFQYCLISALTICALVWLGIVTGFREYWGFWQSPEEYYSLTKAYPLWMREYVGDFYSSIFWATSLLTVAWFWIAGVRLKASRHKFRAGLVGIILMAIFFGGVLGMRCANNFIGLLDRGELHGLTPSRVHD